MPLTLCNVTESDDSSARARVTCGRSVECVVICGYNKTHSRKFSRLGRACFMIDDLIYARDTQNSRTSFHVGGEFGKKLHYMKHLHCGCLFVQFDSILTCLLFFVEYFVDMESPLKESPEQFLVMEQIYPERGGIPCDNIQCDMSRGEFCHRGLDECQRCSDYCGPSHEAVTSDSCRRNCLYWLVQKAMEARQQQLTASVANITNHRQDQASNNATTSTPVNYWTDSYHRAMFIIACMILAVVSAGLVLLCRHLLRSQRRKRACRRSQHAIEMEDMSKHRTAHIGRDTCGDGRQTLELSVVNDPPSNSSGYSTADHSPDREQPNNSDNPVDGVGEVPTAPLLGRERYPSNHFDPADSTDIPPNQDPLPAQVLNRELQRVQAAGTRSHRDSGYTADTAGNSAWQSNNSVNLDMRSTTGQTAMTHQSHLSRSPQCRTPVQISGVEHSV